MTGNNEEQEAGATNVADLHAEIQKRNEDIARLEAQIDDLAAATERSAEEKGGNALASARAQAARLVAELEHERGLVAEARASNEALVAEQAALRARIQDLEVYVEGRKQHWAELHAKIAQYEDTIAGMGKTLKSKDGATAQHHDEKQKLAVRILELERQAAEMVGRRKERDAAYEELERKLAEQTELVQRVKAEYATRSQDAQGVLNTAEETRKLVESLERGVERRDEALAALRNELESERAAYADLDRIKAKLERRVGEIEELIDDRARQVQSLREELRAANEHQKVAEAELAKRVAELRKHREQVGDGSRRIEELEGELTRLSQANANLLVRIESAEARATDLARQRDAAREETENLAQELAAQHDVVASLEAELGRKPRAVVRINIDEDELESLDFAATLADDTQDEAHDAGDGAQQDLLPMEALLEDEDLDRSWIAEVASLTPRKLIAYVSGESIDYPLTKTEMTIGRGKHTDIRIASHFISRVHATIKTQGKATVIEDAGSKNGILVNSARVERCELRDGDIVSLGGELDLKFVDARH